MGDRLMTVAQESAKRFAAGWQWALASGQVMRLRATSRQRWLLVTEGRLWVTATPRSGDEAAEDCWLHAGQHLALPAGQEAVVEAWPSAQFEVLEAAPGSGPRVRPAGRLSAMARAWREGVQAQQWTPRAPAPTCACAL